MGYYPPLRPKTRPPVTKTTKWGDMDAVERAQIYPEIILKIYIDKVRGKEGKSF